MYLSTWWLSIPQLGLSTGVDEIIARVLNTGLIDEFGDPGFQPLMIRVGQVYLAICVVC